MFLPFWTPGVKSFSRSGLPLLHRPFLWLNRLIFVFINKNLNEYVNLLGGLENKINDDKNCIEQQYIIWYFDKNSIS